LSSLDWEPHQRNATGRNARRVAGVQKIKIRLCVIEKQSDIDCAQVFFHFLLFSTVCCCERFHPLASSPGESDFFVVTNAVLNYY